MKLIPNAVNTHANLFYSHILDKAYDASRRFYGHEGSSVITSSNFVSILIGAVTYYLEVFGGDNQTDCCSNMVGTYYNTGTFESRGYIMIDCNSTLRFIQVFAKTA